MNSIVRPFTPCVALALLALGSAQVMAQKAPANASHEAEAAATAPPRDASDASKAAAAREADRASGRTRTSPKTASADAENPVVGEASGDSSDIAKKAAAKPKPKK